ncbi:hypothetical protein RRG08_002934 [Elysia crispata]|uniref:Uncharacterized protein n=1 Tax=Elysia crispata TaxID=231223 RepID=A0AAE1E236_9GAST|nr:hypothetical protein RRG08_002934 [Elysia crispata]
MRLAGRNGNFGGEESSWARFTCRLVDGKQDNNNINQEHTCASLSYGGLCSEDRLKVANLRLDNTASKLVLLSRKRVTSTQLKTDILDWFEEYIPQKAKKAPTQQSALPKPQETRKFQFSHTTPGRRGDGMEEPARGYKKKGHTSRMQGTGRLIWVILPSPAAVFYLAI